MPVLYNTLLCCITVFEHTDWMMPGRRRGEIESINAWEHIVAVATRKHTMR